MTFFRIASLLSLAGLLGTSPAPPAPQPGPQRAAALFPIVVQGRWGFIDSTGVVVIAPRFDDVQPFQEGLALVREAGYYGYLDQTGHFALPPAYAYALPFRQDHAAVMHSETPELIDRTGRLVTLPAVYKSLYWQPGLERSGVWVGTLASKERQVLSPQGRLLSAATFSGVGELSSNRLVVHGAEPLRNEKGESEVSAVGALDGRGRLVIPYYRFHDISAFREGVALASIYQPGATDTDHWGIIDTTGRVLVRLPPGQYFGSLDEHGFADAVAQVNIIRSGHYPNDESYPAPIDRTGRLLFRQPSLKQLSDFNRGRAWAQDSAQHWVLLDKTGRVLTTVAIERVLRPGATERGPSFADGAELVELADGEGFAALNYSGQVISKLAPLKFNYDEPRQTAGVLIFYGADGGQRQGFWNWRTGLLVPPRFTEISPEGYVHGLLAVVEDHRLGYLTPAGRYVWRAAPAASAPLNLDHLRRSFYQVASATQLARYASLGGWYRSKNTAKPVRGGAPTPGQLTVQVAPDPLASAFDATTSGHRLAITNASADTAVFDAQDSSLYLTVQAQDASGQWRSIEYIASSFCGNSYHQVFLAPGQGWQLVVPAYRGGLRTQLRVKLVQHEDAEGQKARILYSNTFAGSVNPAQFWRQPGYQAQGIMDPYTN